MQSSLSTLDIVILVIYLAGMIGLGAVFYRPRADTREFFMAGRSVAWIPVAISIVATDFSAITYLGMPAFVYRRDLQALALIFVLVFIVIPLVIRFFVPYYHRFQFSTSYEYLERRFDARTRTTVSLLFLLLRGTYLGIVIYAPSLVVSAVTGLPLMQSILCMGILTTAYTALGGMRAVIWTDVIQFATILVGVGSILFVAYSSLNASPAEIWNTASSLGKTKFLDFSIDPRNEFTAWAVLLGGTVIFLNTFGADQVILQRYMSTRTLDECRRALKLQASLALLVAISLCTVGLMLSVYYDRNPEEAKQISMADAVLPYFAIHRLPAGLAGLVIASIFAAAMSTLSGGINSLTTATVVDFYRRLYERGASEAHYLKAARIITIAWGLVATCVALYAEHLGELAVAYSKVNSFLGGLILGVFLLGIFTKRATGPSSLAGAALGLIVVITLSSTTSVSWLWYGVSGCSTTVVAGWILGKWLRAAEPALSPSLAMAPNPSDGPPGILSD